MTATATRTRTVTYVRPALYPEQEAALFHDERYGIVEASTKAGKTVGCLIWLHEQAALHGSPGRNFWWVAPAYPQAKIAFRRLKRYLPRGSFRANEAEVTITLRNGAVIWFKSGDNPDSLYGEDVWAAVVDEATRVKAESWHALRSTLTATQGPVRIIGNVKGRKNWAYKLARTAESGRPGYRHAKLDAYVAAKYPQVTGVTLEEIADAEAVLPPDVFKELYLAEPAEEGTEFFDVDKAKVVADYPRHARLCRGWDFAASEQKQSDYTAGVKMAYDGTTYYVVDVVRKRVGPQGVTDLVEATALADGPLCTQLLEEEKGASGKIMAAGFTRQLAGLETGNVKPMATSGSKIARAFHYASSWNADRVVLVDGNWNGLFLAEHADFPYDGDFDDQVDAAAHAFNHLSPGSAPRVRWL